MLQIYANILETFQVLVELEIYECWLSKTDKLPDVKSALCIMLIHPL